MEEVEVNYAYKCDVEDFVPQQQYIEWSDESKLNVVRFDDYKPVPGKQYFTAPLECSKNNSTLVAGMVFYNEDIKEVRRTLNSLGDQISQLRDLCKTQVIVVGDGIKQMDPTTIDYFYSLMCKTREDTVLWEEMMEDLKSVQTKNRTYIIHRIFEESPGIPKERGAMSHSARTACVKVQSGQQYPLTLVLKSENRRKHNSQEWILNSFVPQAFVCKDIDEEDLDYHTQLTQQHSKRYVFMTDCGTLFEDYCLQKLLRYVTLFALFRFSNSNSTSSGI